MTKFINICFAAAIFTALFLTFHAGASNAGEKLFDTALEREIWLDEQRVAKASEWDMVFDAVRRSCDQVTLTKAQCRNEMKKIQLGWDANLHNLNVSNKQAWVRTVSTTSSY